MSSQVPELLNVVEYPFCPKCKILMTCTYKPEMKCLQCDATMEKAQFVRRTNSERLVFLGFWVLALLFSCAIGGVIGPGGEINPDLTTFPGLLFLASALIVCSYILGSLLLGFVKFEELMPAEQVRSNPRILDFSMARLFREFLYVFVVVAGVGLFFLGLAIFRWAFK